MCTVFVCMHMYMSIFISILLSQIQCTCTYAYIHVYICAYVYVCTWFVFIVQALEHDVEAFVSEVQRLEKIARELVSQGHFDTANINARQVRMYCYVSIVINIIPIGYPYMCTYIQIHTLYFIDFNRHSWTNSWLACKHWLLLVSQSYRRASSCTNTLEMSMRSCLG